MTSGLVRCFEVGGDQRDQIESPLQTKTGINTKKTTPIKEVLPSKEILLLPQMDNEKIEQPEKRTTNSLGGVTPHGLKSILSPKAKFQYPKSQTYNFREMANSATQIQKTLEISTPKNFRIKSRASIIKENSDGGRKNSWRSNQELDNLEDGKSQSLQPYNSVPKKANNPSESSEKGNSRSNLTMNIKPPESMKSIKTPKDSKKSFSVPPSKNPSSTKDPSVDSGNSQALGGVEGFVRIVFPSDINKKTVDIADSLTDMLVCKFLDRLSKSLQDYHPIASTIKDIIKEKRVQFEERDVKDFVQWREVFANYLDPKRRVTLITSDKYC